MAGRRTASASTSWSFNGADYSDVDPTDDIRAEWHEAGDAIAGENTFVFNVATGGSSNLDIFGFGFWILVLIFGF